jgi:hypothetical protein
MEGYDISPFFPIDFTSFFFCQSKEDLRVNPQQHSSHLREAKLKVSCLRQLFLPH